jgi:hypothetical protein
MEKCDVCGSDDGIECEILLKGDQVDRIYHLCPTHWVSVYRKSLDDFLEGNEYKTNQYRLNISMKIYLKWSNYGKM